MKKERKWGRRIGYGVGILFLGGVVGGVVTGTAFVLVNNPGLGFLGLSVFLGSVIIGGCLLKVGQSIQDLADKFTDPEAN